MKYYTSNTIFFTICFFTAYLYQQKFNFIIKYVDSVSNNFFTSLINQPEISTSMYLLLILLIPFVLLFFIFIGFISLNLVSLNNDAKELKEKNNSVHIKEFFIIKIFRMYANIIESLLGVINFLLVLVVIIGFAGGCLKLILFNLGFISDAIFNSHWMIWDNMGVDVIRFNIILLICFIPMYFVLILKIIYIFYVNTNFPMPKLSKINIMSWINILHKKLYSDKHIVSVLDQLFEKYIQGENQGVTYYLKRFELGSIARILLVLIIKFILKLVYFILRPLLVLFKAKYFYYILLPFVYLISFVFNFIISFIYNSVKYLFSFLTFLIYKTQVLMWLLISVGILGVILIINKIAIETLLLDYTNLYYLLSNIIVFIIINTFSSLMVYIIIPEFNYYSNPSIIKDNFEYNMQSLETKSDKIRTLIFSFISLLFVVSIFIYGFNHLANQYDLYNIDNLIYFFNIVNQYLISEYQELVKEILKYMR